MYLRQRTKWKIWCAAACIVVIAIRVNCMSGVLGSCFMAALLVWMNRNKRVCRVFLSPKMLVVCMAASVIFAFTVGFVLDIPFVVRFIENVLGRNTTLTGRVAIYKGYAEAMHKNWLLGYVYGSANAMSVRFFGCADAQNAILQWILQSGILTTSMLLLLFVRIFKQVQAYGFRLDDFPKPLITLVYTYIMLGTVEITFSMSFILWIALIFLYVNDVREETIPRAKN